MAGSYLHCVDEKGQLLSNDRMMIREAMIGNLGDAYEAIEEMYGMIWFLASMGHDAPAISIANLVEQARENYKAGLLLAKQHARGREEA